MIAGRGRNPMTWAYGALTPKILTKGDTKIRRQRLATNFSASEISRSDLICLNRSAPLCWCAKRVVLRQTPLDCWSRLQISRKYGITEKGRRGSLGLARFGGLSRLRRIMWRWDMSRLPLVDPSRSERS